MTEEFSTTVIINSDVASVWNTLTNPEKMSIWMGEPEMNIEVHTDWKIGTPFIIKGFHHLKFENDGTILKFEKEKILSYSHLSSASLLPDKTENSSIHEFILSQKGAQTQLTLHISNFPTEVIRKHLEFYWKTTLITFKNMVEQIIA